GLPEDVQDAFKVVCFSEVPLKDLRRLVQFMPGRRCQFEPYGFVFDRDFILEGGGQKVTYINEYDPCSPVRQSYDADFEVAKLGKFKGTAWRKLPFVSTMRSDCDFSWE